MNDDESITPQMTLEDATYLNSSRINWNTAALESSNPALQAPGLSNSASRMSLEQTAPKTANPNESKRKLLPPHLGKISRSNLQSRNAQIPVLDYSKSAYTGRTQETVPKLYQALVQQGDTQIKKSNAGSENIMHRAHVKPQTTLTFHEVTRAVNDFEC